jgi:hypothetical protein
MKLRLTLAFLVLTVSTLAAQTFRGTILGTVTDSTGAVVGGAKVTVRNVGTGLTRTTQTSADGSYSVPELPIGTYTVNVSQSGFQTSVTSGVVVDVASERRVDTALKTGQVSQTVEVSGEELAQVETTSAELGGVLTTQTIENLPVNGRDYTKLIYLNPGIAGSPDQISDSPGSFGVFSMNGSRGRSNNFMLDGTDMNDGYRNDPAINEAGVFGTPATILPIDAVAELRVLSNYEAEYGRNSGAIINIVTKSGTNNWHGSVLEYWRSGQLGARNFFNIDGTPKNSFLNNQFGGSIGGPMAKDKTFLYLDYEAQRESGKQSGTSCVPFPQQIAYDISRNGAPNTVAAAILARNPFPAPNIPTAVYTAGPDPLNPYAGYETGCPTGENLAIGTPFTNRVDSAIAKLDHNFNSTNLFTGRYYIGDSDQSFPFAQLAAGLLPGFNTVTPTRVQMVALSYVKVVNSAQVNELRLGWNRFAEGFFPEDQRFNPASIGLNTSVGAYEGGLPAIGIGGFSQIGATNGVPRNRVDANWHAVDNYSWKAGRNDFKFGYEFRRTTIMQVLENRFRGKLSFDDLSTFLQGTPSGGSQRIGNTRRHTYENSHGFYIQDSFRWSPKLTLNLGVRWDYFGVAGEKDHMFYRFDPNATDPAVFNTPQVGQLYGKDYNNFAPRLAFAYDLSGKGKTVVRGGWGLFYDAFAQDIFLGHFPWNCGFCPGPAYVGYGPGAISSLSLSPGALDPNTPVFDPTSASANGEFFGADPKLRTPYVQNFNLNVQQALTNKAVLQVGYVGSKGTKLFRFRDINQPTQAEITAFDLSPCTPDPLADPPIYCPSDYSVPRHFASAYPYYVNMQESKASSMYHALQTSLRVNTWHGLTTQANFVWSHSIDDASDSEDFIPNQAQPTNSWNPAGERGNSSFDIRRRFTWNFAYQLPKWGGAFSKLKSGWGFDGALSLQDGQPFHLNYNFEGDYSGAGQGFDRPDVVGPIHYGSAPLSFLDMTSFAAPCTWGNTPNDGSGDATSCIAGTRHFGNMRRNSLRGPSFKELNFSISKNTSLSEHAVLQLRAEFFNLFNHPNFANPILPAFIADAGTPDVSTGRHTGFYQLSATGDVGIGNPFLGGGGPRGLQFAAKITF